VHVFPIPYPRVQALIHVDATPFNATSIANPFCAAGDLLSRIAPYFLLRPIGTEQIVVDYTMVLTTPNNNVQVFFHVSTTMQCCFLAKGTLQQQ